MTAQIGIIADDFTGANDSGVRLAQRGLKSKVILTETGKQQNISREKIDVWIVDTDSRAMTAADAYLAVWKEVDRLKKWGVKSFYKKVDSTLRGCVAAELKAMQDAAEMDVLFIAPAFPAMGRTIQDGILYVNGTAVAETEFGRDPKTPVLHSSIPDLLASENIKTAVLSRSVLYSDYPEQWVLEQVKAGVKWVVCDAAEEEDFRRLSSLDAKLGLASGWAGSAGMINHLYEEYAGGTVSANSLQHAAQKILVVSGSLSAKTQEQLEKLSTRAGTKVIEIDPLELLINPAQAGTGMAALMDADNWDSAVLYVSGTRQNREKVSAWAIENNQTANQVGKGISEGLGHLVQTALEAAAIDALIMTGGDTAKDICNILGISSMELLFEVEPGLPLGMVKWKDQELAAITKAGGFGTPDSLANAVDYLKGAGLHANN